MSNDHARWSDAAGAYVLGAMPPDERDGFEAHLASCPACREEVEELRPAAEALPMAAPPMLPPPALKDRIMADVEREAALLSQAGPAADRPAPARRRRGLRLGGWRLAPVAAALVAAGMLIGVLAPIGDPDTRTLAVTVDRAQAPDARAELQVAGGEATLVADDLPEPPAGRVYQVWVMRPGSQDPEPTSTLFLPRRDGSAAAAVPGDVSDIDAVLVTDEPAGGSEAPTRRPLLSADTS
jgi:anti-sigma-K factor RskA